MQLKKVKPREVTKITILVKRLICIALILSCPNKNNPFPNLRAQQSKFGKQSKLTDTKTLKLADIESATTKYAIHSSDSAELSFIGNEAKATVKQSSAVFQKTILSKPFTAMPERKSQTKASQITYKNQCPQ